ncbi:MAG: hypothetical protein D3926_03675 [Desulfobacteraceae bacterium]|nr:MAG: hypothetical protein D3926_03675 [Desulfobacteraceae bacterium]
MQSRIGSLMVSAVLLLLVVSSSKGEDLPRATMDVWPAWWGTGIVGGAPAPDEWLAWDRYSGGSLSGQQELDTSGTATPDYAASLTSQASSLRSGPSVRADLTLWANFNISNRSQAELCYYFEARPTNSNPLQPGGAGALVPIIIPIKGHITTGGAGDNHAQVEVRLQTFGAGATNIRVFWRETDSASEFFDVEIRFFIEPERTQMLRLWAYAGVIHSTGGLGYATAEIDPLVYIDADYDPTLLGLPAELNFGKHYSLAMSTNIQEPASIIPILLLLLG